MPPKKRAMVSTKLFSRVASTMLRLIRLRSTVVIPKAMRPRGAGLAGWSC